MAKSYRPVQRDQLFLMDQDMREWLPKDHLVWWVLEVIERIDTSAFHQQRSRRTSAKSVAGQRGYDPDMLLGLLVFAYCMGERSSRQIERRCRYDITFRVACGGDVPDHTVISRFRSEFVGAFTSLFCEVLAVCAQAGMVRVGTVALDGTKIAANAALDQSRKESRLREIAEQVVTEAAAADESTLEDVDEGPSDQTGPQMGTPTARAMAAREALAQIAADRERRPDPEVAAAERAVKRAQDTVDEWETKVTTSYERQQKARAEGKPLPGKPMTHPDKHRGLRQRRERLEKWQKELAKRLADESERRGNLTDPDSRIMKERKGFGQDYNAQMVVSDDHFIVMAEATNTVSDRTLFEPMMAKAQANVAALPPDAQGAPRTIGKALADVGYFSVENLTCAGPERLIALHKSRELTTPRPSASKTSQQYRDRSAILAMEDKLSDPANQALYKRRGATVEPMNAHIKDLRGLRRFAMRGLAKVDGELKLAAAATNLMRYATTMGTVTT
ncbi:transposase [Gordonia rhizosphera]|uniref:transposase n=1 Tax=Gordonia rhizosphera TaxID=83341 RepID=UPI0012F69A45|nr:transposase [Gordonia rhizosphera]